MLVSEWTVLGWVYLLVPVACWAAVVRTRALGAAVFGILAGLATVLVGLEREWFFTRATAEVEAGYPFAAGLVILAGVLGERRLRGPRPEKGGVNPVVGAAVAICAHALVGTAITFLYQLVAYDAFFPSLAEVPLPPGLTIEHATGTKGGCGSNYCSRTLTIGSTTGLSADQVEARLRAALAADGWTPGRNGALVHPHDWLVDRRVSEVFVSGRTVELSGSELVSAQP
ncbi:hypothetical protein ACH4E7_02195 [Kitasatospora sp. NPDC018058]|uniref:hypothetical protein n=1 Tax=Kitasatospora sp. NPDC018058 TaxID=3364025 RepID=UPI0037BE508F